ncbi:MAG: DUF6178 family protein [Myxococcota bacterium]|nr:DUF6178 family protein [Myxococcota bacterium]
MSDKAITSPQQTSATHRATEALLERIRLSDSPARIVHELMPHDFLLAFRHADDEQRADLLRLAKREQNQVLVDLTCWSTDRPNLDAIEVCILPLVSTGLSGALRACDTLDQGLRTLLLKRNVVIHLVEDRNEGPQIAETSEVIACPDGFYYIEFPVPERVSEVVRALFRSLIHRPFATYQKEFESVRHELTSELEEQAYRRRTARLADFGFVPREDARSLLAPRSAEEVRRMAAKMRPHGSRLFLPASTPVLYRENLGGNVFLDSVFSLLRASTHPAAGDRLDDLYVGLTAMTSTFLTAINADIGNPEAVGCCVRWARDTLALGLAETAGADPGKGADLLVALSPGFFIQVGLGLLYPMQMRARQVMGDRHLASTRQLGSALDPPYRVTLTCLLRDVPCFWTPLLKSHLQAFDLQMPIDAELAAFSTQSDIDAIEGLLAEAEWVSHLLGHILGCEFPLPEETPASVLLLTALANAANGRAFRPDPLLPATMSNFETQLRIASKADISRQALALVAPYGIDPAGVLDVSEEADPQRRMFLRLTAIGHTRFLADRPERALLIMP